MKRWQMYYSIHSMKNQGFSKRQVAAKLNLDFRTVNKYLSMTAEEFESNVLKKERQRCLGLYEGIVARWLKEHPDMTAAQVHDWLKEHYQVEVAERTVRRFVGEVREKHSIPKASGEMRQYEAVEDPPMGKQMQVDLGVKWVQDAYRRNYVKLVCVATVLSNSRYKWGCWYPRSMTSQQFVQSLQMCFEYMGGMPDEIVFDQDRLLAVDENYGDIIFTKTFEQFRLSSGFKVYLCRGSDPESKGRTEAVVKYFKGNFAKNRLFTGIDIWNDEFMDWLDRTGNAKEHGTTKRIPAEVFEQERLFLKPVPSTAKVYEDIVTRDVHKNNTIFYDGNRYTVPLGTYPSNEQVALHVDGDRLIIKNLFGDYTIAEHILSKSKGELVGNNNHRRDNSARLNDMQDSLTKRFCDTEAAGAFLSQIRTLKSRYARDQFSLISKTLDTHSCDAAEKALNYCLTHNLYSAVEFRNAAEYFASCIQAETEAAACCPNVIDFKTAAVSKKRALAEYALLARGGDK